MFQFQLLLILLLPLNIVFLDESCKLETPDKVKETLQFSLIIIGVNPPSSNKVKVFKVNEQEEEITMLLSEFVPVNI